MTLWTSGLVSILRSDRRGQASSETENLRFEEVLANNSKSASYAVVRAERWQRTRLARAHAWCALKQCTSPGAPSVAPKLKPVGRGGNDESWASLRMCR
jgi:hypothetical protein